MLILRGFSGLEQLEACVGVLPVQFLQEAHGIHALEGGLSGSLLRIRFTCNFISGMSSILLVGNF